jgi:hypothetical protein
MTGVAIGAWLYGVGGAAYILIYSYQLKKRLQLLRPGRWEELMTAVFLGVRTRWNNSFKLLLYCDSDQDNDDQAIHCLKKKVGIGARMFKRGAIIFVAACLLNSFAASVFIYMKNR